MNVENEKLEYMAGSAISFQAMRVKNYPPHYHDNSIELLFCIQGTITIISSDNEVEMHSGDIFTIDPHDIHCMFSNHENLILSVCIDPTRLNIHDENISYYFFNCASNQLNYRQTKPMYMVKDILLFLAAFVSTDNSNDIGVYQKNADKIINILINHFSWLATNISNADGSPIFYERLFRISDYCYKNCAEKITISQLAAKEHLNESYFSNFMRKTRYGSFTNMINYMRCYRAEILLLTTDLSVLDISSDCGFSDPKYFYKSFNKEWGCTPAQHRKKFEVYGARKIDIERISFQDITPLLENYIANYHFLKMLELTDM